MLEFITSSIKNNYKINIFDIHSMQFMFLCLVSVGLSISVAVGITFAITVPVTAIITAIITISTVY